MDRQPRTVTVNTKFGSKSVQTALEGPEAIAVLGEFVQAHPDARFEASLLRTEAQFGLTNVQWAWVYVLAQQELDRRSAQQAEPVAVDFGAISAFLRAAQGKLLDPKVKLTTSAGRPVQLRMAGTRSRYYGEIMVTDGAPFGSSKFYGTVDVGGQFKGRTPDLADVLELLHAFAADPAAVAAAYGKATGNCCFCRRALQDKRSLAVGYGPICADNFSLPWGDVLEAEGAQEAEDAPKPKRARKARSLPESAIAGSMADPSL